MLQVLGDHAGGPTCLGSYSLSVQCEPPGVGPAAEAGSDDRHADPARHMVLLVWGRVQVAQVMWIGACPPGTCEAAAPPESQSHGQ